MDRINALAHARDIIRTIELEDHLVKGRVELNLEDNIFIDGKEIHVTPELTEKMKQCVIDHFKKETFAKLLELGVDV